MSGKKAKYVLDSFAILAYLAEEEGADVVEDLLNRAESGGVNLYLNYVNLIVKEADIVTGDPEFESIDMQVLWIRQL